MQYIPMDGIYVYFRYTDKETVMCVMNTNKTESAFSFEKFKERLREIPIDERRIVRKGYQLTH